MPDFLSCYTPTYKRPKLLELCKQSVLEQLDAVDHVIIPDEVGIGWSVFTEVRKHAHKCKGEYVQFLSDDCALLDPTVSRRFRQFADMAEYPEAIIWRGQYPDSICPWQPMGERPRLGYINLGNFVVRRDIWLLHADAWIADYAGDFYFVDGLWERGYRFAWTEMIGWRTLAIMNGKPEESTDDGQAIEGGGG